MTDTDRMLVWLREAMDAAEQIAQTAREGGEGHWHHLGNQHGGSVAGYHVAYNEGYPTLEQATHIALHDPAAVLRRIAADRKQLDLHTTPHTVVDGFCTEEGAPCTCTGEAECTLCGANGCETLRLLAEGWGWTEETSASI